MTTNENGDIDFKYSHDDARGDKGFPKKTQAVTITFQRAEDDLALVAMLKEITNDGFRFRVFGEKVLVSQSQKVAAFLPQKNLECDFHYIAFGY